jgi:Protein of unknown function with PCYCGC motif
MSNRSRRPSSEFQQARSRIGRRAFLLGGAAAGAAAIGAGLWLARDFGAPVVHAYALAPESVLPPDIQRALAQIREAYRFAVANRDTLRYIPCFCNCWEEDGHTSNASCYVEDSSGPSGLKFDRMSLG